MDVSSVAFCFVYVFLNLCLLVLVSFSDLRYLFKNAGG